MLFTQKKTEPIKEHFSFLWLLVWVSKTILNSKNVWEHTFKLNHFWLGKIHYDKKHSQTESFFKLTCILIISATSTYFWHVCIWYVWHLYIYSIRSRVWVHIGNCSSLEIILVCHSPSHTCPEILRPRLRMTILIYGRRQWHPTPVLLPGKPHGRGSLVGCSPWGHTESDTTEVT